VGGGIIEAVAEVVESAGVVPVLAAVALGVDGGEASGGADQAAEGVVAVTARQRDVVTVGHGQGRHVADAVGVVEGVAPGAADAVPLAARQKPADAPGPVQGAAQVRTSRVGHRRNPVAGPFLNHPHAVIDIARLRSKDPLPGGTLGFFPSDPAPPFAVVDEGRPALGSLGDRHQIVAVEDRGRGLCQ